MTELQSGEPKPQVSGVGDFSALPSYTSHKVVKAAQVDGIVSIYAQENTGMPPDRYQVGLVVRGGANAGDLRYTVTVPAGVFARGKPHDGDYLVVYEGNYISWSPKKTFEDGYTRD